MFMSHGDSSRRRWAAAAAGLALAAGLAVAPGCNKISKGKPTTVSEGVAVPELDRDQTDALGAYVAAVYAGNEPDAPAALEQAQGAAYVALRQDGKLLAEIWGKDGSWAESLADAVTKAKDMVSGGTPDTVEIDLAHDFKSIKDPNKKNLYRFASGKRTGIRGIELSYGDHFERTPPTKMLAAGERFGVVANRFFESVGTDHQGFVTGGGKARVYEVQQFLVELPSGTATKLLRGNVYVEPSAVTQANTKQTVDLLIDWMLTHLHEDGRMTYMWLPGESAEKPRDNNMIRQWMATNALNKVAEARDDQALWDRIAKNIDYNLDHFYKQEGEFGLIEYRGKVKLGAMSLAAMAIINHPQRAKWKQQEHGLRRAIASLWREDGSFECFYRPRGRGGRNGNVQNFYPGETLLFWAQLYRESRDPMMLDRFVKSFNYYKDWHLDPSDDKRRRPSFVPWHTQADYIMWETLRAGDPEGEVEDEVEDEDEGEGEGEGEPDAASAADEDAGAGEDEDVAETEDKAEDPATAVAADGKTPEGWPVGALPEEPPVITEAQLVDFVFEMNDWLVEWMEVWEESAFDDEKGRYYSRRRNYGVPHASATGVYVEGLIDAYAMAEAVGDAQRKKRYGVALSRAVRSVMQIQFVDGIDMYYVTDREQTKGGLRTSVLRNEVRVDNVQHVLMGMLKIVDRFGPEDYDTEL